jgi:hypothetical protein
MGLGNHAPTEACFHPTIEAAWNHPVQLLSSHERIRSNTCDRLVEVPEALWGYFGGSDTSSRPQASSDQDLRALMMTVVGLVVKLEVWVFTIE